MLIPPPPQSGEPAAEGPKGKLPWSKPEIKRVGFKEVETGVVKGTTGPWNESPHPLHSAYDPNIS